MNSAFRFLNSGLRLPVVLWCAIGLASVIAASALTESNPYSKIIGRNTFALKAPPPPPAPLVAPPAPPPKVSLQGISTILGRAQALLKVKIDPKPSEPAKDLSLVMDVGQREGEVEVLSIDPAAGTVNISNQGTPLTLSIKDADKPMAGPAIAPSVNPALNNVFGGGVRNFQATPPPSALSPQSPIPTYGTPAYAVLPPAPLVPNRPIRSAPTLPTLPTLPSASVAEPAPLSALEQGVIMEVERVRTRDLVRQGKYPPLPPIPGVTPTEE